MTNVVHRDFTERKPLPAPNSDFYEVYETLTAEELATVKRVRASMEAKVAPKLAARLPFPMPEAGPPSTASRTTKIAG
jgi:hypothetical protein